MQLSHLTGMPAFYGFGIKISAVPLPAEFRFARAGKRKQPRLWARPSAALPYTTGAALLRLCWLCVRLLPLRGVRFILRWNFAAIAPARLFYLHFSLYFNSRHALWKINICHRYVF